MPKPLAPAKPYTSDALVVSIAALKLALRNAKRADAPKYAAAIRRALKSADGARRHAERRARAAAPHLKP